jgi:predicted HicB family RNase H-like nuclease
MKDMIKYKDYFGSVHYSDEDGVFHGKIEFIRALVSYEGTDVKGLRKAFHDAVDDYLALCKKKGRSPERPFKGSFNVRIPSSLHQAAMQKAAALGISLNQFMQKALEREVTA